MDQRSRRGHRAIGLVGLFEIRFLRAHHEAPHQRSALGARLFDGWRGLWHRNNHTVLVDCVLWWLEILNLRHGKVVARCIWLAHSRLISLLLLLWG